MAIEYKIYKSNINNGTKGKFYGRVTYNEMYDLPKLAAHMASHNTSFSRGQILAILTDIVKCIRELLIDSKKVRLDNLGIFHVSIRSKGAKTFEEFVAADNILGLHFRCLGVGESSRDNFQRQARIREKSQHKWGVEKQTGEQETPKP